MLDVSKVAPHIGYYLAGFSDGEGSFHASFRKRKDYKLPWKISLCFNVSKRDKVILALFKRHLKCGSLRERADGVWYYEVNHLRPIAEHVIPFFDRFRFLSAKKKRDFLKFKQLAKLLQEGKHLDVEGIKMILQIRASMNNGGKRRYTDDYILTTLRKSSETIRQAQPYESR